MIAAVLDTNVLATASLERPSPSRLILEAWRAGRFELIVSEHILQELAVTLRKRYFRDRLQTDEAPAVLEALEADATVVEITAIVSGVAAHREDDRVLATALGGGAGYVVTRDHGFLAVGRYRGVEIVTPAAFLVVLAA